MCVFYGIVMGKGIVVMVLYGMGMELFMRWFAVCDGGVRRCYGVYGIGMQ